MSHEVIHDILYVLHAKRTVGPEALTNDVERKCKRLSRIAVGVMLIAFALLCGVAFYASSSNTVTAAGTGVARLLFFVLLASAALWLVSEVWPLIRDLTRFEVYTYQVRQLEAAHDFGQAAELDRFGLAALTLAEKWLSLRIDRFKLRMGMMVGGSDKVAVLAVVAGAWTVWHNIPQLGGTIELYAYLALGAFVAGSGFGSLFANAAIARLSYQRDLVALSICRVANR